MPDPWEKGANRSTPRSAGRAIASRSGRSGKADFVEAIGRRLETIVRLRDLSVGSRASTVQNSEGSVAAERAADSGASRANRLARARPNRTMMSRVASGRYLKSSARSQGLSAKSLASSDLNLVERRGVTGLLLETTVKLQGHSLGSPALTVRNSVEGRLAAGQAPDLKEERASRLARALTARVVTVRAQIVLVQIVRAPMGHAKTGRHLEARASRAATGQLSVLVVRKRIASAAHRAAVLRRVTAAIVRQRRKRDGETVSRRAGEIANPLEIVVVQSDSDRVRVVAEADLANADN